VPDICIKEEITADKAALHVIAQKSEGCLRDALSILDKIVSFTNGHLTYANTLEHLNIMDEDYFFRLLDQMFNQQLTDALLLFDEINQKGFEGDTLLEGFSEFIRNLMVSKDSRAVILLEVADDFKSKYLEAAKKISSGWLIAALNLLNEAEISYKQARNKRLHVELVIIKLSYLQQAVELLNDDSVIQKKKLTDITKPLAFRTIPIIRVKETIPVASLKSVTKQDHQATLTIETETASEIDQPESSKPTTKQPADTSAPAVMPAGFTKSSTSIAQLKKMRENIVAQQNSKGKQLVPLTEEELYISWGSFIEKLVAEKKHSAATNFKAAVLKVISDQSIEIITDSNIQQKFIEQERAALVDHLQKHFCNRQLTYTIIIEEKEKNDQLANKPMSTKEQYLKLIETYPLVKELKDRLRLELDY
jgi:DNA polymerase-3 subunit gamma/tau